MRKQGEWIHGKYQVEQVLGSGGMGVVYATRRRNESRAAVKVLHPRFARDKSIRARFVEEGYLANRVQHPSVVTILEDDIDEQGNFYLVMELLEGVDLTQFVGPPRVGVTPAQALCIADQLLAALALAHQKGIIHRDIKPANVMILRDGRVKLLDFGIAKALRVEAGALLDCDGLDDEDEDDEEEHDVVLGTDRYMSPEQGQGLLESVDGRSDIWAVGALLLALLADQDPSAVPLWDQSYEDRAWYFSRLGRDVPPKVVQILSLALQTRKEDRFASAAEMRAEVQTAHHELYGPLLIEELAVLAGGEEFDSEMLSSRRSSEPRPAPHSDPTVVSRPSHPRVEPPSSRDALGSAPTERSSGPRTSDGADSFPSRPGSTRGTQARDSLPDEGARPESNLRKTVLRWLPAVLVVGALGVIWGYRHNSPPTRVSAPERPLHLVDESIPSTEETDTASAPSVGSRAPAKDAPGFVDPSSSGSPPSSSPDSSEASTTTESGIAPPSSSARGSARSGGSTTAPTGHRASPATHASSGTPSSGPMQPGRGEDGRSSDAGPKPTPSASHEPSAERAPRAGAPRAGATAEGVASRGTVPGGDGRLDETFLVEPDH